MNKDPSTYIPEAVGRAAETADRLSRTAHDAKEVAADAAHRAQLELQKLKIELARVANKTEQLAKENPWAAAGTMLGVGVLLGAVGYHLFAPRPTLGQMIGTTLVPISTRSAMKKQFKAFKNYF